MGARNPDTKSVKFYSLKAKVDATNDPFFSVSEKIEGSWKQTGTFNEIFGKLTKVEILEKEYEGVVSHYFRFRLEDENEVSNVDMTHNAITYSILNSLASDFDTNKEVTIRVYKTSNNGNDGKIYYNGRAYVSVEGETLSWVLEPSEFPKPEQIFKKDGTPLKDNGKNVYDKEGVISFWEEFFNTKVAPKFSAIPLNVDEQPKSEKPTEEKKPPKKQVEVEKDNVGEDEDDDLPF